MDIRQRDTDGWRIAANRDPSRRDDRSGGNSVVVDARDPVRLVHLRLDSTCLRCSVAADAAAAVAVAACPRSRTLSSVFRNPIRARCVPWTYEVEVAYSRLEAVVVSCPLATWIPYPTHCQTKAFAGPCLVRSSRYSAYDAGCCSDDSMGCEGSNVKEAVARLEWQSLEIAGEPSWAG